MADINIDELGPVDYLAVGFPADNANFSGEIASEPKALIDNNTVRVLDLVMITKGEDGFAEASHLGPSCNRTRHRCRPACPPTRCDLNQSL